MASLVVAARRQRPRERALTEYGRLAYEHNFAFHRKCIEEGRSGEDLMGSSDLSAAAGLDATVQAVRRMPVVPLAGKRAAAVQSLLYTSRLNGLDPAAWLRDTLEKLPTCPNSQIDSLLPLRAEALHHPSP